MTAKLAFLSLTIACAHAMAADTTTLVIQPATAVIKTSSTKIAPRTMISPTVNETRATRMPDGTLALTCTERPNPKAQAARNASPALPTPGQ